jgi:flagellar protein FliO/FliZ
MTPGFTSLLWFAAVLALIPLALWFVKRSPMGRMAGSSGMRQVAALSISPSQRIVTVEIGRGDSRCWLVLGVTPHSINTLHTMLPQDEAAAEVPASPNTAFVQLLQRLQGRGPDAR